MLVVDANVALEISSSTVAIDKGPLIGPPLLWSEVTSWIRRSVWRGDVTPEVGDQILGRFLLGSFERRVPDSLYREATRIAGQLGWAKTYDAEYIALASIEGCPLITADGRLRRGAGHLVEIIGPTEL
jgi:predicted nucleic acid-binding protein